MIKGQHCDNEREKKERKRERKKQIKSNIIIPWLFIAYTLCVTDVLVIFWSHVRSITEQTHGQMESRERCFHLVISMGQRKDSESPQRMTFIMSLFIIESQWLSGRASESGIHRSEVRFLMGTQNFFLCPMFMTRQKHLPLFLYWAQNLPSLLFCLHIKWNLFFEKQNVHECTW